QLAAGEEANRTGNGPEAVERFQAALDLSEALCDERSTGDALEGLGVARWLSGDSAAALEPLREALVIRQRLGQTAEEALNWNDIGLSNYSLARYPEALDAYRRALEVDAYAPSARLEGVATMNIGLVYRFLAHYGDAEEWMERSLAIRRGQGNPAAIGQTLNALGLVARARGRFAKALDLYAEALPLRREGGDRQGEAQTLNGIGVVLMDLGQFEEAKPRFQESLVIAKKIGYKAQIGFAAWNIGVCLTHLGHEREGLERYDEALAVWKKLGRRAETARTLSQLGDVCIQLGDLEAARANLEESLAIAREIGEPDPEASDLDSLGVLDLRAGRPSEALARMDAALSLARTNTMPDIEWQVQADRARALRALGRDPEAVEALRASVRLIDDLRAEVRTDPGKIGFLEQRRRAFEDLVEALTRAGLPQEALEVAEACRARALADLLGQRGGAPHPDAREALEDVRQALEETRATPLPTGDAAVAAGARGAPDRVDAALSRLRKRDPELASLLTVETPTGEDIRQAVSARRGTLVEYLLTEDRLFLWSLSPEGELHEESLEAGRGRLASLVQAVLADMNRSSPAARRDAARRLRELDRLLIEPVARWLPARPEELLIVAPQGILSLLPFAALLDRSGRTLLERHTLVVVPAVSVLRYTANKGRHSPGLTSALVVADPVPPRGSGLERLAGARREGALVAAHFPESRRDVLTGAAATEAAVKSRSGGREVLHFATHGLVSDRRPLDSALLLAEGEGEDGYLRADEIFGLVLHADLVVLSGCSTGLGEVTGEGILGLTRAFLYAGTPSVVVSQWDVDDRATTFLMDRFYANLQAGHGKAEALRAAQLEAQRRFRDPALWAGFELVGEP
ncbi:MAG TPA: CHAT domain-containing tetratricopeptide repeat protein, partial [Thermoanaerobaculia bacterium]|nr:CHAT domain-containing tetratricopeptide repeat protein [Thermoanaerobaculia bacterium]